MEIRRSYDRLISTMGFPILVRWHLYIESAPRRLDVTTRLTSPPSHPRLFAQQYHQMPVSAPLIRDGWGLFRVKSNFNAVYAWMFTKVRKTCLQGQPTVRLSELSRITSAHILDYLTSDAWTETREQCGRCKRLAKRTLVTNSFRCSKTKPLYWNISRAS